MTDDQTTRDEQYGTALLSPLRGEPGTPPRIDVARAMTEGRRRRGRKWAGGAAIAALTVAAATGGTLAVAGGSHPAPRIVALPTPTTTTAAPEPGPTNCTVTRLPYRNADQSLLNGGDPGGHYLTGQLYGSDKPVVIWKDGVIVAQMTMPGASNRSIKDLNRSLAGVAGSYDNNGVPHAYAYRDKHFTLLKGGAANPAGLNDAGVIAGTLGADRPVPAIWSSPAATPARLKLPSGAITGEVGGIDEDGTVVGSIGSPQTEMTGYLWLPDGTGRTMSVPPVEGKPAQMFWPESISNGWVAGRAVRDTPDGTRTFAWYRYRVATNTYEALPTQAGMPADIAANGWVSGVGSTVTLTANGKTTALPTYRGRQLYQLTYLSADGHTLGGYSTTGPADEPLVWRCH